MKAAVSLEPYKLEVRDVPEFEMAHDHIKVKIAYAGICGTDPEIFEGRFVSLSGQEVRTSSAMKPRERLKQSEAGSKVMLSEPVASKREIAKKMGADVVVDPLKEDLKDEAMKLTDGRGFNICLEASGIPAVAKEMIYLADL